LKFHRQGRQHDAPFDSGFFFFHANRWSYFVGRAISSTTNPTAAALVLSNQPFRPGKKRKKGRCLSSGAFE
jgi:hypothetical protein